MLIDTHTHIFLEDFKDDIDDVIKRALDNDVQLCFLPNIDRNTIADMHLLSDKYPDQCFPMMGLHPCSVKADFKLGVRFATWLGLEIEGLKKSYGPDGSDYYQLGKIY